MLVDYEKASWKRTLATSLVTGATIEIFEIDEPATSRSRIARGTLDPLHLPTMRRVLYPHRHG